MEERKRRDFFTSVEVPNSYVLNLVRNTLQLPPLCYPPSGEPTCMGTSPPPPLASILKAKKPFKHLGVKGEAHHQVSFSILGGGWTAHHTQEGISQVWVEVREECLKHFESCIVLATSRN
jgi:hypothetical protein